MKNINYEVLRKYLDLREMKYMGSLSCVELHDLYRSLSIVRIVKSRLTGCTYSFEFFN